MTAPSRARRLAALAVVAGVATAPALPAAAGAVDAVTVLGPPPATAPVWDHDAPDPDVLRVTTGAMTTYYAYTTAANLRNIQVLSSPDLRTWTQLGDALPSLPAWQVPGRTWAPGVVALGGTYVLFYASEMRSNGLQCISEATAATPTGPFTDRRAGPLVCQTALGGSIDPSPFVDDDGTPYLYWKSNGGASPLPADVFVAPLSADGSALTGSPVAVLHQDEPWELTIESPEMVHVDGQYLLFYSGGVWNGAGYGVGYARCDGPGGPCVKPVDGPVLYSDAHRLGPGGESLFTDSAGDLYMAYAAWDGPSNGFSYAAGDFRSLWIAAVTVNGTPTVHAGEPPQGYLLAAADGGAFAFGAAAFAGSMGGQHLNAPVVGMAEDPSGGYWMVASDGGVFSFDAPFLGSMGGTPLAAPVVGMAATPDGHGYWLVASDGGVFAFGDAGYAGSMGGQRLNAPVVGMAATPDGRGYWLAASDGGIFSFGDAGFAGSMGGHALNAPVVGMAAMPQGGGYWEVAADGGIFSFGAAGFYGSMGGSRLARPVVGVMAGPGGGGYWMVASDGGIFTFGDADWLGSLGDVTLQAPVVSGAAH